MAYAHSFTEITPPARYDATAWAGIRVEQAATTDGPWTEIDDQPISPDLTPEDPAPVDITTVSELEQGYFRFRFVDDDDVYSGYSPVYESPTDVVPPADYAPSVSDLGAIMRARTRDENGNELGTFTAETKPTFVEAQEMIDQALPVIAGQLGDVPSRLASMAQSIVALRAAMYVEVSYFPEETNDDQSAFARYKELYETALAMYTQALEGGAVNEPDTGVASVPIGSYYSTLPGYVYYPIGWLCD